MISSRLVERLLIEVGRSIDEDRAMTTYRTEAGDPLKVLKIKSEMTDRAEEQGWTSDCLALSGIEVPPFSIEVPPFKWAQ